MLPGTDMQALAILASSPYIFIDRIGETARLDIIDFVPVFVISLLIGIFFRLRRNRVHFAVALIWGSIAALVVLYLLYAFGPFTFPA
jgi:hypothetical protein